jgi:hypothetical protein
MNFPDTPEHKQTLWPPTEWDAHLAMMGRIVFQFNQIEDYHRRTLIHVVGKSVEVEILTAHLGSNTINDALRTIANEILKNPEKDRVNHNIKVFERVREYRNYFVHGMIGLKQSLLGAPSQVVLNPTLHMRTVKARNGYFSEEIDLDAKDLENFARYLTASVNYFVANLLYFSGHPAHSTLPEKLPLPDKLNKSRRVPLALKHLRQSSPQ